jgi:hypothetical protein
MILLHLCFSTPFLPLVSLNIEKKVNSRRLRVKSKLIEEKKTEPEINKRLGYWAVDALLILGQHIKVQV